MTPIFLDIQGRALAQTEEAAKSDHRSVHLSIVDRSAVIGNGSPAYQAGIFSSPALSSHNLLDAKAGVYPKSQST